MISRSAHSVLSDSLQPHWLQHTRLPCSSLTPSTCSNSCPSSRWCHPTISSSVVPFSSCLQSFPASGSFGISQFFTSGSQSIGTSASASVKQIVPGQMLSPIIFYCCRFTLLCCFWTELNMQTSLIKCSNIFIFLTFLHFPSPNQIPNRIFLSSNWNLPESSLKTLKDLFFHLVNLSLQC